MSHVFKNILIAATLIFLFLGIFIFMTQNSDTRDDAFLGNGESIADSTNQILNETKKVNSYELDVAIFSDSRFASLVDFHSDISDVHTGRANPFLPVE